MDSRRSEPVGHQPVMAGEVVEILVGDPGGAYLDLTAGGGGHLKALAECLKPEARLYATDVDPEAVARTERAMSGTKQFRKIIQTAFADLGEVVDRFGESAFNGILLDLGMSSYQLDDPARGISFQQDGPLDMRFDSESSVTAGELVNNLEGAELKEIFGKYGEERQAARIAAAIVRERQRGMILTTSQLKELVLKVVNPPHQTKSLARVFQALRIAVNRELDQLSQVLPVALSVLIPGGRLAVIAYHSLEDRIVKRFFREAATGRCTCPDGLPACLCGAGPSVTLLTGRPLLPSADEIKTNPRSRSARLRAVETLS